MATIYLVTQLYYNFMTTAQQFYRFWPILWQKLAVARVAAVQSPWQPHIYTTLVTRHLYCKSHDNRSRIKAILADKV